MTADMFDAQVSAEDAVIALGFEVFSILDRPKGTLTLHISGNGVTGSTSGSNPESSSSALDSPANSTNEEKQ